MYAQATRPLPSSHFQARLPPYPLLSIKGDKAREGKRVMRLPHLLNKEAEVWVLMTGPFEELVQTGTSQDVGL